MNIEEIPTPGTNAFMLEYNRAIAAQKTRPRMWDKSQSLERRLTVVRDALSLALHVRGTFDDNEEVRNRMEQALVLTAPKHDYHCLCNKCVGIEPKKHACRACGGKGVFSKANVNVEATGGLKKDHE